MSNTDDEMFGATPPGQSYTFTSPDDEPAATPPKKSKGKAASEVIDLSDVRSIYDPVIERLQEQPWLQNVLSKLDMPRFTIDETLEKELCVLARRYAGAERNGGARIPIVRTRKDLIQMQEENGRCLADRDRVTEIRTTCLPVQRRLEVLWDSVEERLMGLPVYRSLKNDRQRQLFCMAVMRPIYNQKQEVALVLDLCEEIVELLTQTHFAIKQASELAIVFLEQKSA